jgi:hypothetical protein
MSHVIVFASRDDVSMAYRVIDTLETAGIACWFIRRDLRSGDHYLEATAAALRASRIAVLVLSSDTRFQETEFAELAIERGVPVVCMVVDRGGLEAFRAIRDSVHVVDASTPALETHLAELVERVRSILDQSSQLDSLEAVPSAPSPASPPPSASQDLNRLFFISRSAAAHGDRGGEYSLREMALLHADADAETIGIVPEASDQGDTETQPKAAPLEPHYEAESRRRPEREELLKHHEETARAERERARFEAEARRMREIEEQLLRRPKEAAQAEEREQARLTEVERPAPQGATPPLERERPAAMAAPPRAPPPAVPPRKPAMVGIWLAILAVGAAALFNKQIAGIVDAIWEYIRNHVIGGDVPAAPIASILAAGGPAPIPAQPSPDWVDVSAFAPRAAKHGEAVLVQVYLHTLDQARLVTKRARGADETTTRRDVTTLATRVARGQTVTVVLDVAGVEVDDPSQEIEWTGQPRACRFFLWLPESEDDKEYSIRIRVLVDSVPRGKLGFKLPVTSKEPTETAGKLVGTAANYRHAFLSYASPDLAKVLQCAQVLKSAGITYFQDLLELKPKELWEERLFKEIDSCQLFLLFWSSHAAKSKWVIRETEHAIACQKRSHPDEIPEIAPVILEGPPVAPPPESLKHIHFNDPIRYVISAVEAVQHRGNSLK